MRARRAMQQFLSPQNGMSSRCQPWSAHRCVADQFRVGLGHLRGSCIPLEYSWSRVCEWFLCAMNWQCRCWSSQRIHPGQVTPVCSSRRVERNRSTQCLEQCKTSNPCRALHLSCDAILGVGRHQMQCHQVLQCRRTRELPHLLRPPMEVLQTCWRLELRARRFPAHG